MRSYIRKTGMAAIGACLFGVVFALHLFMCQKTSKEK